MKIILNSITFDPLVQILWNDKHVQCLITSFPIIPKVEQGTPPLKRVMACDTSKQTNTLLNWVICKVTLSSPCLWAYFHRLSPLESKNILLNLGMKCWNWAFNARGKTGWNSVCHENWWFSEFHPLLMLMNFFDGFLSFIRCWMLMYFFYGFLSLIPPWMLMYFFAGFSWISPCVWSNSGFWCCVFLTLRITVMYRYTFGSVCDSREWKLKGCLLHKTPFDNRKPIACEALIEISNCVWTTLCLWIFLLRYVHTWC
jgi:hypothetical protein